MTEHLRILAFNWRGLYHPQAGGAELNLFEQARRWVRDGHDVTVVVARSGKQSPFIQEEEIHGVRVLQMGNRFTVYAHAAAYAWRHGHEYDCILDVANGIPFFTPVSSKGTPSVLLVHHVHDKQWYSEFPSPVAAFGRFLERRVVPWLYAQRPVIAVSPTTRDALLELGFEPEQVRIVYNGVSAHGPLGRRRTGTTLQAATLPGGAGPRVAYVGRIKKYKRIELLVSAVASLRAEFPSIHLDIAGSGDALPELEALVEELGLEQNVTLYGYVDEETKVAVLRRATVFATPSMHEGWGLSVIEANAYGCPAVAFDVPGLRVAIRHGRTGLLASDQEGFEQAIGSLLRDPAYRQQLSAGARTWARRFSWDAAADETLRVLRSALDEASAPIAAPGKLRPARVRVDWWRTTRQNGARGEW